MNIFLDMDGVIVEWWKPVSKILKIKNYPCPGNHNCVEHLGLHMDFWRKLNRGWYASLPWTDDGKKILEICKSYGQVTILTSHTPCGDCIAGKQDWLQKNVPELPWVITQHKHLLACGNRVLIDDCDENVSSWQGPTILVPREWNRNQGIDPVNHVKHLLKFYKGNL